MCYFDLFELFMGNKEAYWAYCRRRLFWLKVLTVVVEPEDVDCPSPLHHVSSTPTWLWLRTELFEQYGLHLCVVLQRDSQLVADADISTENHVQAISFCGALRIPVSANVSEHSSVMRKVLKVICCWPSVCSNDQVIFSKLQKLYTQRAGSTCFPRLYIA